ncbi:MAG: hypothetical protein K8U03_12130 [Planctomycetia bacterium]|nr:hypothetical protein [Planctomycetia bacterium]
MRNFLIASALVILLLLAYVRNIILSCGHPYYAQTEISQLHSAMRGYQERYGEFPPCLADASLVARQERFMKHLATAFPGSAYGKTVQDYQRLRERLLSTPAPDEQAYLFINRSGQPEPLNLDMLDPAESLVFWLGGFPAPFDAEKYTDRKSLFGFHRDRDNPFRRDSLQAEGSDAFRFRTDPLHDFRNEGFTDNDADGWLEYSLYLSATEELNTPVVYFDAATYQASSQHAALLGTVRYPADGTLVKAWGYAIPYLEKFSPAQPETAVWREADSFQLIDAGKDNRYGPSAHPDTRRMVELPSGRTYTTVYPGPYVESELSAEEKDNRTSFVK